VAETRNRTRATRPHSDRHHARNDLAGQGVPHVSGCRLRSDGSRNRARCPKSILGRMRWATKGRESVGGEHRSDVACRNGLIVYAVSCPIPRRGSVGRAADGARPLGDRGCGVRPTNRRSHGKGPSANGRQRGPECVAVGDPSHARRNTGWGHVRTNVVWRRENVTLDILERSEQDEICERGTTSPRSQSCTASTSPFVPPCPVNNLERHRCLKLRR
jgi:hypothetical protein